MTATPASLDLYELARLVCIALELAETTPAAAGPDSVSDAPLVWALFLLLCVYEERQLRLRISRTFSPPPCSDPIPMEQADEYANEQPPACKPNSVVWIREEANKE